MEVIYAPKAIADLTYWKKTGNKAVMKKIQQLIAAIQENPFEGIGKPEALKYDLVGKWSRRINHEHRIIYVISDKNEVQILDVLSLKGHYGI